MFHDNDYGQMLTIPPDRQTLCRSREHDLRVPSDQQSITLPAPTTPKPYLTHPKISKIHRNFVAVEEIKSNLANLDRKLGDVDRMLAEDEGDGTPPILTNLHSY